VQQLPSGRQQVWPGLHGFGIATHCPEVHLPTVWQTSTGISTGQVVFSLTADIAHISSAHTGLRQMEASSTQSVSVMHGGPLVLPPPAPPAPPAPPSPRPESSTRQPANTGTRTSPGTTASRR
jgi:hypothetical protein